jgi:hypothetical protein
MAVSRLYQKLEASNEWKRLNEEEREELKEHEKENLMRDRYVSNAAVYTWLL